MINKVIKKSAKKKVSVKKKAVKRKKLIKKAAPKRAQKKKTSKKKRLVRKVDVLHKDGSEQFTTSDELLDNIVNYRGRPTKYAVATINRICSYIALGYSLNKICSYSDMPAISTVLGWLNDKTKEDFLDKYMRAREMKTEIVEDSLIDIADSAAQPVLIDGEPILIQGNPVMVVDNASVQHARLRIDTRTRHMEVTKPKRWGKNIDLGQGGGMLLELMDRAAGRLVGFKEKQGALIDGKTGEVVDD